MDWELPVKNVSAMVIDSHVHFWDYEKKKDAWITDDMSILQDDFHPRILAGTLARNGVDGCIAVQVAQSELETHYLVELAKAYPIISGVVGWIDLLDDELEKRLEYFSQYPAIRGWRHVVQAEADDFLRNKKFQQGVRALHAHDQSYDILIYALQLPAAIDFASNLPDQRLILDHCGKPEISAKKIEEWKTGIREIAQAPNVYCKLSGLFTEATWKKWSVADFYPYLDTVVEAFGIDRLLFGSDWPVILLSGIYVQWKSLLEKYFKDLKEEDRDKIFGGNARIFYQV